jgi:hypothetical protein
MAKLMIVAALVLLAAPAADEELDKAAAKAAEMGNYTSTITTKFEGMGGGGGGGGDRNQPVELQVKPDAPVHLKRGDVEAFRKGEVLVAKEGDAWKRVERPEGGGQGGEGGRRRGNPALMLRGVQAPHEVLKNLKSSAFKEVKREDGDGGRVFSGELTEEGLKALRPGGGRRGGGGGGGQDRPAPKATGTAKVWVNGDGVITKYEVHVETTFKNRDGEDQTTKMTSTVEIKEVGSTKYDVPEAAAKEFEAKSAEK